MPVATRLFRPIAEPMGQTRELLDRLFIGDPPFFGGGELGLAHHAVVAIAARPGDHRRRTGGEQVDPVERVAIVELDVAALDQVVANVVGVEIQVEGRLELAGVRTAAGELALPPPRQELLVDRQEVPPP